MTLVHRGHIFDFGQSCSILRTLDRNPTFLTTKGFFKNYLVAPTSFIFFNATQSLNFNFFEGNKYEMVLLDLFIRNFNRELCPKPRKISYFFC